MIKKIFGPPGTGKTTTLLNLVDEYIKKGTDLNRIGYFAFTRKAANEARDRMLESCLLYTSPSPRDGLLSRMPSSA